MFFFERSFLSSGVEDTTLVLFFRSVDFSRQVHESAKIRMMYSSVKLSVLWLMAPEDFTMSLGDVPFDILM